MNYKVGQKDSFTKTISDYDVYGFAGISGDLNPAHVDDVWAAGSIFKKRIAHGILVTSYISAVLGQKLPGNGTIYLSQEVKFLKPVYIGDTITAYAEITEVQEEKKRLVLRTWVENQDGEVVVDGQAVVMPPRK